MKHQLLSLSLTFACMTAFGQTNVINNTGNVGIGTLTPVTKLEISSAGLSNIQLTHTTDDNGVVGSLRFNKAGTEAGRLEVERTITSNRMSDMKFFVKGATLFEAMRIANTGNVGIGTAAPAARLDVSGPANTPQMTLTQSDVADAFFTVKNGTFAAGSYIPTLWGRSKSPGRPFGLFLVGEAEELTPGGADAGNACLVLDGRTKDGGRLNSNNVLAVNTYGNNLLLVKGDGSVGIGTTDTKGYKLAVNGAGIFTRVKVQQYASWPDYVFSPDYALQPLEEVEKFIKENKHLPGIPSASQVAAEGLDLGEMNKLLLQKVEELTLYILELKKEMKEMKQMAGNEH